MKTLFFWNEWKTPYKYLYQFLFLTFLFTLGLYLVSYFAGIDAVIDWETKSLFDSVKVSADQFIQNLFTYSIETGNYLIREKYIASTIQVQPLFTYIYFILVMLGILIALTVITRLELVLFALGMGIFIFFIVLLHTEILGIFGPASQKFTLLTVILFGGLSFYFQAYDQKFSFIQRLFSFMGLTVVLALVVHFGSQEKNPFLYMANFGLVIPVILSMAFIIAISFDIINGFLFITNSSKATGKNTLMHFSIISSLYLINLLLIYLKKKGIITGELIYIDVFIIYIASSVIGIWGLKKRTALFTNIISASNASFLYIALAIVSTATITYSFITGNDPLTEAFQYAILYSHLGMGVVFFLYIIYNFWELFYKNISAYDLVYAPRRMPFFMVRPLGIVIILSLFMQSGMFAYKLTRAGYHNFIGDTYLYEGKLKEAKEAYNNGSIYGYNNRRSNYALASVLSKMNEKKEAAEYYTKSLEKYPSEYAYANLGNIYAEQDMFFQAFFTLKEGLNEFPESGHLYNNMAMLYSSKGIWDSTLIHLEQAKKFLKQDPSVASNLVWLFARKKLFAEADSMLEKESYADHLPYQTNKIALYNLNNEIFKDSFQKNFLKDSVLNGKKYSYLYNYGISKLKNPEETFLKQTDRYIKNEENIDYYYELNFLKFLNQYYSGNRAQAIKELRNLSLTAGSATALYYNKVLGQWAMKHGAYRTAASDFKEATSLLDTETKLYHVIALLEAGDFEEGMNMLDHIKNAQEKEIQKTAQNLIMIFSTQDLNELNNWDDVLKFHYLHFRKPQLPEQAVQEIASMFTTEKFKIYASAEIMEYYLDKGQVQKAEEAWTKTKGLLSQDSEKSLAVGELNYQFLKLLKAKEDWQTLSKTAQTVVLNETDEQDRLYFFALAEKNTGNNKDAESYFKTVMKRAPYNVDAFIQAAALYNEQNKISEAYNVLLEGLVFNKYSADLYKAYALQALRMNLSTYAEETLDNIKELTSPQDFAVFKQIYESVKAEAEKAFQEY